MIEMVWAFNANGRRYVARRNIKLDPIRKSKERSSKEIMGRSNSTAVQDWHK
jgi:hypothetical protein